MSNNSPSFGKAGRGDAVKESKNRHPRNPAVSTDPLYAHPFKHKSSGVKGNSGVVDRTGVKTGSK
jgi:hypothetical protein